jgi:membrane-bound ClpP family serine protease
MSPFILLAIGLLLIFIEFYLPGAVMGVTGTILVLISIFLFASTFNSSILTILYIIGTTVCVGLLIKFALRRIVKAKPEYSIYSNKDQKNYYASSYDKTAIGKKGIVLADLKPGGYITIEGKQHQAISLTGYLTKGTEVIVVSGDGESLSVRSEKKE